MGYRNLHATNYSQFSISTGGMGNAPIALLLCFFSFNFNWFQSMLTGLTLLQEHKFFEDAFKVYERGVKIFKYPHVKDIWVTYLSKFVKRYGMTKLERTRELFERAVESVCTYYWFRLGLIW